MKPRIEHVAEMDEAARQRTERDGVVTPLNPFVMTAIVIADLTGEHISRSRFADAAAERHLLAEIHRVRSLRANLEAHRTRLRIVGFVFSCVGAGMILAAIFGGR
jgi:hypothetical protein